MWNEYHNFADDFYALCQKKDDDAMIIYDAGIKISSFSYKEAFQLVCRYLAFFYQKGMKAGDTIVAIMPNSPETILCFFAAAMGGYNFAPIPCAVSQREYNNWIGLVHPKIVLKKENIAEFDTIVPVYNCACNGDLSWLPREEILPPTGSSSKVYLMTSGTTGAPKAMSIDINKLWSSGRAFAEFYKIESSGYRFWNYLPMSYLGGLYNLALIPLSCQGSFVISEPFSGKTILNYWNFVTRHKIDALWVVPSIVQGLVKISGLVGDKFRKKYSDIIKIAFLGTAPIQLKLKEKFEEIFGIRLYENFALSESTFLTAEQEDNIRFREQGSVGKILPYVSLKFALIEGMKTEYTIWIKSPFLFEGYLTMEGTEKLDLDEDGYFNSQDLGYLNDDEVLVLSGRSRDIIKKGGLFISLIEIENTVKQLPYIEEAVAVPISHDFYGEAYVLCVIFNGNTEPEKQKEILHLWMLDNFVNYKMPELIYIYEGELPKTSSGKIQKNKIASEIEEQLR